MQTTDIATFVDLYVFLQQHPHTNILEWLTDHWVGKDKQESLLRLFAGLRLIVKLHEYTPCGGNFNLHTIRKARILRELFYSATNVPTCLKDKGDSSDLTAIHNANDRHLLVTTSKNISKVNIGKLDIDKILTNFQQYSAGGFTMSLCICIRRLAEFTSMCSGIESSNDTLKALVERSDTIIVDWADLNQAYIEFKSCYATIPLHAILDTDKVPLCLKMHQRFGVMKTLRLKSENKRQILWGHVQRSGKSYMIAGCIIRDSAEKTACNYLVITTAPNETIVQQLGVFVCVQLAGFTVVSLCGKTKEPRLGAKNIIVCSKQFLQTKITTGEKTNSIAWLKRLVFDMRFIDESHNGGTTSLAQKTLNFYGATATTVQITATYYKPSCDYNIPACDWILWDLEDIKLCKTITAAGSIARLTEKHGELIADIIRSYSPKNIMDEYEKYPDLWILTDELKPGVREDIIRDTRDNYYGWSAEACFLLKQGVDRGEVVAIDEFQNEPETLKMWRRIFGNSNAIGIPSKDFPDDIVFIKRIERICKNPLIHSRFIGDTPEPAVIMAFLPQNKIGKITRATIALLKKHNVLPAYDIIGINSKTTGNPKKAIDDAVISARNSGKVGVLVLSGRQCSLGVSIDNCDIVLLLNNTMSHDMIYQMMFRAMTESPGKKCGFVVDLNIRRVIETSVNYASQITANVHPHVAVQLLLQERIITLNGDHWLPCFGHPLNTVGTIADHVYDTYASNTEVALKHFLDRLQFKECLLTQDEHAIFNALFAGGNLTEAQLKSIDSLLADINTDINITTDININADDANIKSGIEPITINSADIDAIDTPTADAVVIKEVNYMDILHHMIPLICLLTIHTTETSLVEMFSYISGDERIYNILIDQTRNWWGRNMDTRVLSQFIAIYIKYIRNDAATTQIIRTVKELFVRNLDNRTELSKCIDTYLVPQALEKKSNAEVSTPFALRRDMLDKIPAEFWTSPHTVFEPCAGKGGFLIDIIDRFMSGLAASIPDERQRYKTIVEDCLYFSDINATNIFICRLLIDPCGEYKVNCNEGNTLGLDVAAKWGLGGFDAVIGNPPYQDATRSLSGTLWDKFVSYAIIHLNDDGFLCYVHPSGWRNIHGKFKYVQQLLYSKNLVYLEIHNVADGITTFKATTRYDWYVLQNTSIYRATTIKFEDGVCMDVDVRQLAFIPNAQFVDIYKLFAAGTDVVCNVLYSRSGYGSDKKWVSRVKTNEFIYPCIYTISSKSELKLLYSSRPGGFGVGVPKLMWSNGSIKSVGSVIDADGTYGLTEFAYGISDTVATLTNIKAAFDSLKFRRLMESCAVSQSNVNYKVIALFRKDFWREFV
jgi:hypothetical protein